MTWLLPWALGAAAAAAIAVGLLHLLARDRPVRWLLPTARFVAPGSARATRRARTPRDLLLLALRVLALVLAGAAFAGPVLHPEGGAVARVVLLDRTAGLDDAATLDSARAQLRPGDRLVVLDSAAWAVDGGRELAVLDSLRGADSVAAALVGGSPADAIRARPITRPIARPGRQASLSGGMIAAVRAAAGVSPSADSVALRIVSSLLAGDAALERVRALWPGRADVIVLRQTQAPVPDGARNVVRGPSSDAVVAGARVAGALLLAPGVQPPPGAALLVRSPATAADSAHAREGGTLIVWPSADRSPIDGRGVSDTIGGLVVHGSRGTAAVVFPAVRSAGSAAGALPAGNVMARWIDGAPAVTDAPFGRGCIRTAAIAIPQTGDLTLRPAFQELLRHLMAPCGAAGSRAAGSRAAGSRAGGDSLRALLAGTGPLARAGVLRETAAESPATPWLLGAALLLLLLEPLLRRTAPAHRDGVGE